MKASAPQRRGRPLVWHLAVFGAALVVPAIAFIAVLMAQVASGERERYERAAEERAIEMAAAIDAELAGLAAAARALATDPALGEGRIEDFAARARAAVRARGAIVLVTLSDGARLLDTREPPGHPPLPPDPAYSAERLAPAGSYVSDLVLAGEEALVAVNARATVGDDAPALVSVAVRSREALEGVEARPPASATVIDRRGVVLARSADHDRLVGTQAPPALLRLAADRSGHFVHDGFEGAASLSGYARTASGGWIVVATIPEGIAQAQMRAALLALGGLGLGLLGLAAGLAALFGRRAAAAMARLRRMARSLAAGDRLAPIATPLQEANEIGDALVAAADALEARAGEVAGSERRLRDVLDNLFAVVVLLDADGVLLEINRAPLRATGLKRAEVVGRKVWEVLPWSAETEPAARLRDAIGRAGKGASVRFDLDAPRGDGRRIVLDVQVAPLRDGGGRVVGLVVSGVDVTARVRAAEELRRAVDLLRIIGETTPDPIYVRDADGRFVFANPALAHLLGAEPEALIGATGPSAAEGAALAAFESDLEVIRSGEPRVVEEEASAPRELRRTFLVSKTPMRDAQGRASGLVCVGADITDRKRAEERQALMVRELHHRVKNSLATVQAIANATARTATDVAAFRDAFNARIISLARTHTLLTENAWGVIPLRGLVSAELAPYETAEDGTRRVILAGPDVALPSDVALSLGMALHELTTNAVKYGALSARTGTVSITWAIDTREARRALKLAWVERGGPAVTPPSRQGFGARLLRHMLGGQFNSEIDMRFDPEGLTFTISLPLVEPARPADAA